MNEETYGSIGVLWWCSLLIGIWCIVAYMFNHFEIFNHTEAWNNLYPNIFPLMTLVSIFGFLMTSQYKICVKFGWIKLEENLCKR